MTVFGGQQPPNNVNVLTVMLQKRKQNMGLLDFIFGKSIKIDNQFFGTMLFLGNKKDPSKNYFECRRNFKPSDKIIEIGIDGDASGPSQTQIDFFRMIENKYTEISNSIKPLIEDEFRNWNESFQILDFQKEFEPVYLRIPRCENRPTVWNIAFESEHDRNHNFSVTMIDFSAKELLIDG